MDSFMTIFFYFKYDEYTFGNINVIPLTFKISKSNMTRIVFYYRLKISHAEDELHFF